MEEVGKQVRQAIVQVRSHPSQYASSQLSRRLLHYDSEGNYINPKAGAAVAVVPTKEGPKAVRHAIKKLLKLQPIVGEHEFCAESEPGLDLAAADHCIDLCNTGKKADESSDGVSFADRMNRYGTWSGNCGQIVWFGEIDICGTEVVARLIVDDGVRKRTHRKMILNPKFKHAGIAVGPHPNGMCCVVIQFATNFEPDRRKINQRHKHGMADSKQEKERVRKKVARISSKEYIQCGGCGLNIRGRRIVTAAELKWHEKCFLCKECDGSLLGKHFMHSPPEGDENAPRLYCQECWQKKNGKRCGLCNEFIEPGMQYKIVQTNPPTYEHPECRQKLKEQRAAARETSRKERRRAHSEM